MSAEPDAAATGVPWETEPGEGRGAWIKDATGEWTALSCGNTDESAKRHAAIILERVNGWAALLARAETAERRIGVLREASTRLYEMCLVHGDFRNGVTDSTGSIDEGDVLAGRILDAAKAALDATDERTGEKK